MSEQVNLKTEIEKCEGIVNVMKSNLKLMVDENTRLHYSNNIDKLKVHIEFMRGLQSAQQNNVDGMT